MTIEIREYQDGNGRSPYGKWFDELNAKAAAKITGAIDKIARGLMSNVESVGGGVLERKIDYGPGYRVYFSSETDGKTAKNIILLYGGTKRRQSKAKTLTLPKSFERTTKHASAEERHDGTYTRF